VEFKLILKHFEIEVKIFWKDQMLEAKLT
jgi:hypothetical protein